LIAPDECVRRLSTLATAARIATRRVTRADRAHDDEERLIATWASRRQAEFRSGRTCAREILASLGAARCSIPFDGEGAPCWPAGFVGSISHKRGFCLVAVARRRDLTSLGLDLERDVVADAIKGEIASADELAALGDLTSVCVSPAAVLLAAKEASYKFQYPVTRTVLTWKDVVVTLSANTFVAEVRAPQPLRVAGVFTVAEGWIAALAIGGNDS
jgi:4'-phosphopantetheinyl transferase EntD